MTTNEFENDNDEPIHHFEGKELLNSCPSEPPFAQSGNPSSPITHSPHATISPPEMQDDLKQENSREPLILNININLIVESSVVNFNHLK